MNTTSTIRSRANNVFKYDVYHQSYSRILWHDGHGPAMYTARQQLRIPSWIDTIELDLTPAHGRVGKGSKELWHAISIGSIHGHALPMSKQDKIFGSLPDAALKLMQEWLAPETIELLLHIDYMSMIDLNNFETNGPHTIDHMLRLPISCNLYLAELNQGRQLEERYRINEVRAAHDELVKTELRRQRELTPHLPLLK